MNFKTFIDLSIQEDCPDGDITSESLIQAGQMAKGILLCKQDLILAGIEHAQTVFKTVDKNIDTTLLSQDGHSYQQGDHLMQIRGSAISILKAERLALNILQRMAAIATKTKRYVDACQGYKTKILDTRKTTPLMRELEKYAVTQGGGINHRFSLSDEMMIKDNHLEVLHYDFKKALHLARQQHPDKTLVLEVSTLEHVRSILPFAKQITRVMLDNMNNQMVAQALQILSGKIPVEVSGGITLERIPSLCQLGVDYISVGALTHSIYAADISLELSFL